MTVWTIHCIANEVKCEVSKDDTELCFCERCPDVKLNCKLEKKDHKISEGNSKEILASSQIRFSVKYKFQERFRVTPLNMEIYQHVFK